MNYDIKGGFLVPNMNLVLTDEQLITKKYTIPCKEIKSIKNTVGQNGALTVEHNGKFSVIPYAKSDVPKVEEFVQYINDLIVRQKADMRAIEAGTTSDAQLLNVAEKMYQYCLEYGFGYGYNAEWGVRHFQVLERALQPKENVLMPFIGLHNYVSPSKHDGYYAYAITDRRLLMAHGKMLGEYVQGINLKNINDISMTKGIVVGTLIIDSLKEKFSVSVPVKCTQRIFDEMHEALDKAEKNNEVQPDSKITAKISSDSESPMEQIKKWKELLDLEIITAEEFAKKKKELLGL